MDRSTLSPIDRTLDRTTGRITVQGPIDDPILAKGLLAEAQRIIDHRANQKSEQAKSGAPAIVLAHGPVPRNGH